MFVCLVVVVTFENERRNEEEKSWLLVRERNVS
jgi:hypothetical protein